jgi:hypothetical protein
VERWSYVLVHFERYAEMQIEPRDAHLAREAALAWKLERRVCDTDPGVAAASCGSAAFEAGAAYGGSCVSTCGAANQ